jgi:hypothetical protein
VGAGAAASVYILAMAIQSYYSSPTVQHKQGIYIDEYEYTYIYASVYMLAMAIQSYYSSPTVQHKQGTYTYVYR